MTSSENNHMTKECGNCRHSHRDHCHIERSDSSGNLPVTGTCKIEGCNCKVLTPMKITCPKCSSVNVRMGRSFANTKFPGQASGSGWGTLNVCLEEHCGHEWGN